MLLRMRFIYVSAAYLCRDATFHLEECMLHVKIISRMYMY